MQSIGSGAMRSSPQSWRSRHRPNMPKIGVNDPDWTSASISSCSADAVSPDIKVVFRGVTIPASEYRDGMKSAGIYWCSGGAAAWPMTAHAQHINQMRSIGVLLVSGPEPLGPFREALGDLRYVEGKKSGSRSDPARRGRSSPQLAAERFAAGRCRVAVQTPAARAAEDATVTIPIVVMAGDPIATGLSRQLTRPDGGQRIVCHRC